MASTNEDMKMALEHNIPLEVLHEGMPRILRDAPDNQVQHGRLVRISSATGLGAALRQSGPGAPLKVYIVSYLRPSAAAAIREMIAPAATTKPPGSTVTSGKGTQKNAADKPSASAINAKPQPQEEAAAAAPPQPQDAAATKSLSAPFKLKIKLRSHSQSKEDKLKNAQDGKEEDKLKNAQDGEEQAKGNAGSGEEEKVENKDNAQEKESITVKIKVNANLNAVTGGEEKKKILGFVIANMHVLEAKEMAMMAMAGEMAILEQLIEKLASSPDLHPHDVLLQLPSTVNNLEDNGTNILLSLKQRYLLAHIQAGHSRMAQNILKYVNHPLYNSMLEEDDPDKASNSMAALRAEYESKYPGRHSPGKMAKQILGVAAHMDWEKRKAKILSGPLAGDKKTVVSTLKKRNKRMDKLSRKQSLIGAALPDYRTI